LRYKRGSQLDRRRICRRRAARDAGGRVQSKPEAIEIRPAAPENAAAVRRRPGVALPLGDATWLSSSFDLAQGLEVKVMESKLSRETLDQLFRS
jgi:hypothetical protein